MFLAPAAWFSLLGFFAELFRREARAAIRRRQAVDAAKAKIKKKREKAAAKAKAKAKAKREKLERKLAAEKEAERLRKIKSKRVQTDLQIQIDGLTDSVAPDDPYASER